MTQRPRPTDVFIAVMGVVGVGKSTLISLCTNQQVVIGHGLGGGTQEVAMYTYEYSPETTVYMIDTPGFDDDERSDSDVLREIAAWLTASYSFDVRLNGIVYLHRITDRRLGGRGRRNLTLLHKLCGSQALSNVVLVTSMWEQIDAATGEERETELRTRPEYWGDMIANGSQTFRHMNNVDSVRKLVDVFASKHSQKVPKALDLQVDMVDNRVGLEETEVGKELDSVISRDSAKLQRELDETRAEMARIVAQKDEEAARAREQDQQEIMERIRALEQQREDLRSSLEQKHQEQLLKFEERLREVVKENTQMREALERANQDEREQNGRVEEQDRKSQQDQEGEVTISAQAGRRESKESVVVEPQASTQEHPPEKEQEQEQEQDKMSEITRISVGSVVPVSPSRYTNFSPELKIEYLVRASEDGRFAEVESIIRSGVDVNGRYRGWTALGQASKAGHLSIVRLLVQNRAKLEGRMDVKSGFFGGRSSSGNGTALSWAAHGGHIGVVTFLISCGAQPDVVAKDQPSVIGIAATPVVMAADNGHLDVVRFLMELAPNSKATVPGWDALVCACATGHLDVVQYLVVEHNISVRHHGKFGKTLLHYAVECHCKDSVEVMGFLKTQGARLDDVDANGNTPLHYAVLFRSKSSAKWLRNSGANSEIKNKTGHTPLALSKTSRNEAQPEMIKILKGN